MRSLGLMLTVVAAATPLAASAGPKEDNAACANTGLNAPERIEACSRWIGTPEFSTQTEARQALSYFRRGFAFAEKRDRDNSIADYDKAIALKPDYADAYINRGNKHREMKDYEMAIADYSKAIDLSPDNANAVSNRGATHYQTGDYDQALQDYNKAITLNPTHGAAFVGRGMLYALRGLYSLARSDFEAVLRLDDQPTTTSSTHTYARGEIAKLGRSTTMKTTTPKTTIMQDKGACANNSLNATDRVAACTRWMETAEFAAQNTDAQALDYFRRGYALADLADKDKPIADYTKALELKPDYPDVLINRGNKYREKKEYTLAIADYNRAIELRPNDADAVSNRGATYYMLGDYDQTLLDYNKAISLKPTHAAAFVGRGMTYALRGEYSLARSDFETVLRLDDQPTTTGGTHAYAHTELAKLPQLSPPGSIANPLPHDDN